MKNYRRLLPSALAMLLVAGNIVLIAPASAAQLGYASIRLDRMASGTFTTFRLRVKPATAGSTSVAINFNGADSTTWTGSGGTLGAQASQVISTTNCVNDNGNGDVALTTGSTFSFTVATSTLTVGNISSFGTSSTYCADFTYAQALKTPTAAGEYHPTVTVGTDVSTIALRVVTSDQILVTAIVPPTFNFALGATSDTLGTLTTGSVASSGGVTATINTNARNGWVAWIKDSSSGLNSTTASKTIASATAGSAASLSGGTEGYGVGVGTITQGSGAGTTSAVSAYSGANGGGVDTTLRQVATSNGTAGNASFVVKEYAAISTTTPAATDYSDTITVVGAGNF